MKPPPFAYECPTEVGDAVALLAAHGEDARPLAGGQSLVPLLNFRLARPAVLVDLNRIEASALSRSREAHSASAPWPARRRSRPIPQSRAAGRS